MLSHLQLFENFVRDQDLFAPSETVLLAVSGGKDSVAMANLFKDAGCNFAIAHCNFQLRGEESIRDELFVKSLAKELEVPFHLKRFETSEEAKSRGESIQMVARALRYQFFDEVLAEFGYDKTATAHHQDDAIETLMLNLIRGTGLAGLHGIKVKSGSLIRPLLCFNSSDIQLFAQDRSMAYVEDSSNSSLKYTRNKIRHQILPLMREINPSLESTLMNNIRHFEEAEDFIETQLEPVKANILEPAEGGYRLSLSKIKALSNQTFILHALLTPFGFNDTAIADLLYCVKAMADPGRLFYSPSHVTNFDREFLLLKEKSHKLGEAPALIQCGQRSQQWGAYSFVVTEVAQLSGSGINCCFVDGDKLIYPLTLRSWEQGDAFVPFGMKGKKKLSDYFISQKVPLATKNEIPLLVNGEGKIIWVVGYRSDDRFKVSEGTKKIITFERRI